MTENKKIDENQTWMISMIFIPSLILINIGRELTSDFGLQILYSGIFGALGGVIGITTYYLTKEKSRVIKAIGILVIFGLSISAFTFIVGSPSDDEIMEQEWFNQRIGRVAFETPTKLELFKTELPDTVKWFFEEIKLYSDGGKDRATLFIEANITTDTLSIATAYSSILEGMLSKMNVDFETFDMDVFQSDEEEIYSMFSIDLEGENVNGYGYFFLQGKSIESIWLMPIKKGFTKEYIEYFDLGIYPEY